jgi:hypothetical protein
MKRAFSIGVVALSLVGMSAQHSQAATITFDNLASGTVLTNQYPDIVSWTNPLGGSVYALDRFSGAGNGVSINSTGTAPFNASTGAVDITFAAAQQTVSIDTTEILNSGDMFGFSPLHSYMSIYNANGFVTNVYATLQMGSGDIKTQTLSYTSAAADITKIRLSVQYDSTGSSGTALFAEFDNLTFNTSGSTGGGGDTGVPEPASLAMMSLGLATAAARKFRQAKTA